MTGPRNKCGATVGWDVSVLKLLATRNGGFGAMGSIKMEKNSK